MMELGELKNETIVLLEDMHVHSTFSDGLHSPAENLRQAEALGLQRLGCVDHVRRDTAWLGEFVRAIDWLKGKSSLQLYSGIETKLLNQAGDLDMPDEVSGVDFIFIADHQFPLGDAAYAPNEIKERLAKGTVEPLELFRALIEATEQALLRHRRVVIAHLFSVLPKVGLSEEQVPEEWIAALAQTALATGAQLEVDERWKCPSLRTVKIFHQAGVPIRWSTDSHRKEKIGKYQYNLAIAAALLG